MEKNLTRLKIDQYIFKMAFDRDVDYEQDDLTPNHAYLDKESGEIHWIYETDEDADFGGISSAENRATRELVKSAPERFIEIPGRDHGDHHDILKEFLNSEWTDDEGEREKVQAAYFGSIGGWKEAVDDESIAHTFEDFRDNRLTELAEGFLREHEILPDWSQVKP